MFYIPAIPAFVIGGNVVSLSRLNTNDKYCTFPLFYTVIAAFCMIPVFNIMYSYDSLIILAYLVGIGLPFGAVYWLSLMML